MQTSHLDKFSLRCCKTSPSIVEVYSNSSICFAARFCELLQTCLAFLLTVGIHDHPFGLQQFLSSQIYPLTLLFGLLIHHTCRIAVTSFFQQKQLNSHFCNIPSQQTLLLSAVRHQFLVSGGEDSVLPVKYLNLSLYIFDVVRKKT